MTTDRLDRPFLDAPSSEGAGRAAVLVEPFEGSAPGAVVDGESCDGSPGDACRQRFRREEVDRGTVPYLERTFIVRLGESGGRDSHD